MSVDKKREGDNEPEGTLVRQAAINVTRQRVASDLHELVDRFTPAIATQRIEANLRARLARLALSALRRPEWLAGAAAAGVALFIWRLRKAS